MTGAVTFELVAVIASVVAVAVGVAIYVHKLVRGVQDHAAEKRKELEDKFAARCLALTAETMTLAKEFAAYREHALETFMSKAGGGVAIDRVGSAVLELKNDMAHRLSRLENILLENGGKRGQ